MRLLVTRHIQGTFLQCSEIVASGAQQATVVSLAHTNGATGDAALGRGEVGGKRVAREGGACQDGEPAKKAARSRLVWLCSPAQCYRKRVSFWLTFCFHGLLSLWC
jgi:hypothetical protein